MAEVDLWLSIYGKSYFWNVFFFAFQTLPASLLTWGIYCIVLAVVFAIMKFVNFQLHHMFDTSEVVEEETDDKESKKENGSISAIAGYVFHVDLF